MHSSRAIPRRRIASTISQPQVKRQKGGTRDSERYRSVRAHLARVTTRGRGIIAEVPNRLAAEQSPYLLQHKDNPVDWYPWGQDAFDLARRENKPIFLSVGYSTCHWCHVMEHESFENPVIAEVLSRYFVSIKVDREERPDVDRVYMTFVQATTGSGGWPMSVWLTPTLEPFYGGTYSRPRHDGDDRASSRFSKRSRESGARNSRRSSSRR